MHSTTTTLVAPVARQGGTAERPSGEVRLARELDAPSGEFRLARGLSTPSGGVHLARELDAPSGEFRLARGLNTPSGGMTTPPEIIPYYRLNHSTWSLSDNKEASR
jgi:hypothetical protein